MLTFSATPRTSLLPIPSQIPRCARDDTSNKDQQLRADSRRRFCCCPRGRGIYAHSEAARAELLRISRIARFVVPDAGEINRSRLLFSNGVGFRLLLLRLFRWREAIRTERGICSRCRSPL